MGDLVVVVGNPSLGLLTHFGEIAEDVHVEHATLFDETFERDATAVDQRSLGS